MSRVTDTRILRSLLILLMIFTLVMLEFEMYWWSDWDWHFQHRGMRYKEFVYGGIELFSPAWSISPLAGWARLVLVALVPVLFTFWMYFALRNLKIMGLHTPLESRWVFLSWLIPPLMVYIVFFNMHQLIVGNHAFHVVVGDKKKKKKIDRLRLQQLFDGWWIAVWLCRFLLWYRLVLHVRGDGPDSYLFEPIYLLVPAVLYAVPLVWGIYFLFQIGKLEDEVLKLWDSGLISRWREEKLIPGQFRPDHGQAAEWYVPEEKNTPQLSQDGIFTDQNPDTHPA